MAVLRHRVEGSALEDWRETAMVPENLHAGTLHWTRLYPVSTGLFPWKQLLLLGKLLIEWIRWLHRQENQERRCHDNFWHVGHVHLSCPDDCHDLPDAQICETDQRAPRPENGTERACGLPPHRGSFIVVCNRCSYILCVQNVPYSSSHFVNCITMVSLLHRNLLPVGHPSLLYHVLHHPRQRPPSTSCGKGRRNLHEGEIWLQFIWWRKQPALQVVLLWVAWWRSRRIWERPPSAPFLPLDKDGQLYCQVLVVSCGNELGDNGRYDRSHATWV